MRITDVTVRKLVWKLDRPMASSQNYFARRAFALVQVETDDGIVGIGEAGSAGAPLEAVEALILGLIRPAILGEDPLNVDRLWQRLHRRSHQQGRRGLYLMAMAGVDIALWDIVGKATRQPLFKLLGGFRDDIPAYASGGFYMEGKGPHELAEELGGYVEHGYRAVKMKVGRNPEVPLNPLLQRESFDFATCSLEEDLERVQAARRAIGPKTMLLVDVNNAWTPDVAIRMGRAFQHENVYWLEEPVLTDDVEGSAIVARELDVAIAGYETELSLAGYRDLITRRAIDIAQPDVTWAGGITSVRKIAALAESFGMMCTMHTFGGGVGLAASLHVAGGIPNAGVQEFDRHPNPLRDEILQEPIDATDGMIAIPTRPGLGIELNWDVVERHTVP